MRRGCRHATASHTRGASRMEPLPLRPEEWAVGALEPESVEQVLDSIAQHGVAVLHQAIPASVCELLQEPLYADAQRMLVVIILGRDALRLGLLWQERHRKEFLLELLPELFAHILAQVVRPPHHGLPAVAVAQWLVQVRGAPHDLEGLRQRAGA